MNEQETRRAWLDAVRQRNHERRMKTTDSKNYTHDYPTPSAEGSINTEAK